MNTLRVRAKGDALVCNYEALDAGVKRFVGREYKEIKPGTWAFCPKSEPEEVPNRAEYRRDIVEGALEAADKETAQVCGVPFVATAPKKGAE